MNDCLQGQFEVTSLKFVAFKLLFCKKFTLMSAIQLHVLQTSVKATNQHETFYTMKPQMDSRKLIKINLLA